MPSKFKSQFQIFDISIPIHEKMAIYPNNPKIEISSIKTPSSYLSKIIFGTHTGTHIDVPRHVIKKGKGVDKIELEQIVGECRVLDMTKVKESIKIDDLKKYKIKKGERILVKTKNSIRGFKKFYKDYIYLDGDAADYLTEKQIVLFGIDALSVKKPGSSDVRAHTSFLKNEIVIFEGLDLSQVKEDNYYFIGLPLKMKGLDGAPARVILIK